MYNEYQEYMRNVLGYNSATQNTYQGNESNYGSEMRLNQNIQEINYLYPEIYGVVYPLVQKMCSRRINLPITEEELSQMVNEIYDIVEPENETQESTGNPRNGDVRNPRAKDIRRQPRRDNRLLRDLIRILLIRELFGDRNSNNWNGNQRPEFNGLGPIPAMYMAGNPRMI